MPLVMEVVMGLCRFLFRGTPNYNYNWSNGATTSIVSNVSSGTYSVTVFDQNGCTNTANIDVVQPTDITVNYVRDSVSCLGGSNGSAIALVSGGVPGYTYLWENGNTSNTINNLSPGYYNLTIIDSNACIKQDSVEILGPTTSIAIDSMIVHPITCHDANNGSITILAPEVSSLTHTQILTDLILNQQYHLLIYLRIHIYSLC